MLDGGAIGAAVARVADRSAAFFNLSHGSAGHIAMRGFYLAGMLSVPAIGISLYGFEEFLVPSVIVFVAVAGFTLTIRVLESTRNNR